MPHSQKIRRGSIKKRKGIVPSLASSMRRSSIGLPLRPSYSQDGGDDMTFDDAFFDGDGASEEPESPRRGFEQRQQTPRGSHVNVIQDGDDESVLEAPSKGKEKATNENHDGGNVEKEISQGLENVDTQRRNEDDEATPKKKPTKKRSRKKRGLLQNDVGGCFGIRRTYPKTSSYVVAYCTQEQNAAIPIAKKLVHGWRGFPTYVDYLHCNATQRFEQTGTGLAFPSH